MRFAPAGKVREIATGIGVVLSAGLIYFVRALKPEDLLKLINNPNLSSEQTVKLGEQFNKLLEQYAGSQDTLMPPALAARALWDAAHNTFSTSVWGLSILGVVALSIAGWLAALAYREGWVRGLEGTLSKLNTKVLTASLGERFFARFGQMGHILYRDIRLLFRDATQWSQLLILVALVGVYLISIRAYPLEGALGTTKFRNIIGYLQLAFQSFVIAGIGIRVAFPAVSLEGYGYWILRTGPVHIRNLVLGKYFAALPPMLIITTVMAIQSSNLIKTTPMITSITLMVGISSALVITALGVGLGAAFPKFKADNPSEIPMSPGGLLYMLLSLAFAAFLALLMAQPAFFSIQLLETYNMTTSLSYWLGDGLWISIIYITSTVIGVAWPLVHGINKLSNHEEP
jgi:ABC-2 type transport system permease protein